MQQWKQNAASNACESLRDNFRLNGTTATCTPIYFDSCYGAPIARTPTVIFEHMVASQNNGTHNIDPKIL